MKKYERSPVLRREAECYETTGDQFCSELEKLDRETAFEQRQDTDRLREPSRLLIYRSNYQNDFVKHTEQTELQGWEQRNQAVSLN